MHGDLHCKFTDDEAKFFKQGNDVNAEHRFVQISPDKAEFQWKRRKNFRETNRLMTKVVDFIQKPKTADTVIKIDGDIFYCHMHVLQSYSNFFVNRSRHEKSIELNVEKISGEIFYKIYNWFLSSTKTVERESLIALMSSAEYLQIEKLLKQCWEIVKQVEWFQEEEAFLLYRDAKERKIEMVQTLMRQQVKKYFLTVVATRDFLEMDADEVANWLRMDSVGVNCEVEVFFVAARWLLHEWEVRKKYVMYLIKHIRFALLEPWRVIEYKRNEMTGELREILKNQELQKFFENDIYYSVYRNCFKDEYSNYFCDFLFRFGYKRIFQRDLINDPYWRETFNGSPYMYEDFRRYISFIRSNHKIHWTKISYNSQKKHQK